MDNVWLWICELPNSPEWSVPGSNTFIYPLATSIDNIPSPKSKTTTTSTDQLTIHLKAERTESDVLTFFINVCRGDEETVLWSSKQCPLSSDKPFLPLILQLLQEIIDLSSNSSTTKPPQSSPSQSSSSQKLRLKPDPVEWILTTHTPESLSGFFSLIFLTRLFWLCAFNAPSEVGFLYFQSTFPSRNLDLILSRHNHTPILRAFFLSSGVDVERSVARAVGYMLVKCLIMKEMSVGLLPSFLTPLLPPPASTPTTDYVGLAYATEAHGLWILKSHTPVWAMRPTRSALGKSPFLVDAKESALRYSLAHQQLEAVIQLEYSVRFRDDDYIQVTTRVDNIRLNLVKLGFQNKADRDDDNGGSTSYGEELYFPSRVQAWIGPETGSSYVSSLSLGKSTGDNKREIEMQRVVKGNLGNKQKAPKIKATSRTSTRAKVESWRWDQDADGNSVVYDGVLHDPVTGAEVYKVDGNGNANGNGLRKRYAGGNRLFTKSGSLVIGGGECGEEVKWRIKKEMEGSVMKWRFGGKVWLSYCPSEVENSKCFETRCVEVWDEVDLPLMRTTTSI